ncbi:Molybdopterin synthase catalytic subunit [Vermiconidia calcicola]|uniref:Molybdopterin synthase catalytic subunit n=1 Tax=Vermiconidia calcicola TaxID=1690605 RepID=A0ACC3MGG4_9PEZI|nr:Molybdopterin synthase catalytic subunit [Vermiconidia calcicola]
MADTDRQFEGEQSLSEPNVYLSLTYEPLDSKIAMDRVKSPKAGAVVLFAGCTRDSFADKPVTHLRYTTYAPLALRSMQSIARYIRSAHDLVAISITHRLGQVDIGEESILIAISAPHRQAAWRAGEECLERVKASVEIWKEEWFENGGVWRSNRDGSAGVPVNNGGKGDASDEQIANAAGSL